MRPRAHRLLFVRLRVRDARHPVAANAHDDVANLVQQLLFIGRTRLRLVARPQRRQCAVHPAKLLADAALGKKMGGDCTGANNVEGTSGRGSIPTSSAPAELSPEA